VLGLGASLALSACGGQAGPPKHPIAEMSARAIAKVDVIELVVSDPARAARLRQIYLGVWELGREFDLARARTLVQARASLAARAHQAPASAAGDTASAFEPALLPSLDVSTATLQRYTQLMLEARSLLTESEFHKLDAVR
jgi:hypothetical protein